MEMTHKRAVFQGKREIRKVLAAKNVSEALGAINHGCEIYGLSKGQFSLIDIITHCLEATGPADVAISTWTAAGADLKFAYKLMTTGAIRALQFIIDFSFPTRQPEYCAALRQTFGDDCIRITKTHAKFVLIRNAEWNLVIRSSMNLNENRRLESFEISDDKGMAEFLQSVITDIFETHPVETEFSKRPYDHVVGFESLAEENPVVVPRDVVMKSTDVKKFYSDEPFGNDMARSGISYLGGSK